MAAKTTLALILILLVVSATVYWLVRAGADRGRGTSPIPESHASEVEASETEANRASTGVEQASGHRSREEERVLRSSAREGTRASQPSELDALLERLRELLANKVEERGPWVGLLRSLVDLGTPEAIGAVLEAMQDPDCEFPHRAAFFAQLLEKVDDPRILAAASAVLEANLETNLDSWYETWGYIELIAAKGGPEAGKALTALLSLGGQVALGAAQNVWRLEGKAPPEPFLRALEDPANTAVRRELAGSLARWNDPGVRASLEELAGSPEVPGDLRREVLKALASHTGADELSQFGRWYWSSADDEGRALALDALGYLGYASEVDDVPLQAAALPILTDALRHPSREVWIEAVQVVTDHEPFHVAPVRDVLAALLNSVVEEADRVPIRKALARVEGSLR